MWVMHCTVARYEEYGDVLYRVCDMTYKEFQMKTHLEGKNIHQGFY